MKQWTREKRLRTRSENGTVALGEMHGGAVTSSRGRQGLDW